MLGYNHNISHLGRVFHVQTEDSGPAMPRLFTHLFFQGTILASRKHEYDAMLPDDKVRALMQGQHKSVIRDLLQAKFDEKLIPFFHARGEDVVVNPGAIPSTPMSETPPPLMTGTTGTGADASVPGASAPSSLPVAIDARASADSSGVPVAPAAPGNTRPLASPARGTGSAPVVVRPPEPRRSPFVRNMTPPVAKVASTDGVVVQRSVVVGGPAAPTARPARIRPPVPYVVTGGAEPSKSEPPRGGTIQPVPIVASPDDPDNASGRVTSGREGLPADKNLDDVIRDYLGEEQPKP